MHGQRVKGTKQQTVNDSTQYCMLKCQKKIWLGARVSMQVMAQLKQKKNIQRQLTFIQNCQHHLQVPQVMDACTNASRRCFNIRFWRRTLRRETPLEAKGKTVLQQASVNVIGNKQNHAILKCPSDSVDWSEKTSCSVRRFMVIASLRHDRTRV